MRILLISLIALSSGGLNAASLQVINAIPQVDATVAPTLSLYIDGVPALSQIRYASMATLAEVPTGMRSYSVRSGERVLAERQFSLSGAATNGHIMALAGDGTSQAYRLISWQVPTLPPPSAPFFGAPISNQESHSQIHLAPRWDMISYVGEYAACWAASSPSADGARRPSYESTFSFGIPNLASGSSASSHVRTCQMVARSTTKGALALRLPELTPGAHVLTHFFIGNGTTLAPFEWLTIDNGQILARGHGSYASGPVLAGPRFFGDPARPGSGVFIGADSTTSRLFGFVIGQGSDFRSTWTLIDGPRVSANQFKLTRQGGGASTNEEYLLTFQSCTEATLERRVNGNQVSTRSLRRGMVPKRCDEYQQP